MNALIEYAPLLAEGTAVTIALALLSLALATALGAIGAAAKLSGNLAADWTARGYTTLVRGVPDLVLILLIYFGGQRLLNVTAQAIGFDHIEVSKFGAGVFAIGFIYGAYLTETFRGAYQSVPKGQGEGAKALGLDPLTTLRLVVLPQLMRLALAGYANVWMVLVKSTAVVSVIGLSDLVGLADKAGKSTRQQFWFYLAVLLVYLAITIVSEQVLGRVEKRLNRGEAARNAPAGGAAA
ncbi:MAG: ABC transporter permease subunit [Pseudomonadota bacterium]